MTTLASFAGVQGFFVPIIAGVLASRLLHATVSELNSNGWCRTGGDVLIGSRCGKSRLIETLIQKDLENGHTVCVVDPKADPSLNLETIFSDPEAFAKAVIVTLKPKVPWGGFLCPEVVDGVENSAGAFEVRKLPSKTGSGLCVYVDTPVALPIPYARNRR